MENQEQLEEELLQLTPKQLRFLCIYATNGGNGREAATAAGYSVTSAASIANENLNKPDIQRALATITHDEVYTTRRLLELMGSHALDGDMADFEPFLDGKVSLCGLKATGVNTKLVRKVSKRSRTTRKIEGEVTTETIDELRTVELHNAQSAARDLLKIRAQILDVGEAGGENQEAAPQVNVTLVTHLRSELARAHNEPFVPGIPRLDGDRSLPKPDGKDSG